MASLSPRDRRALLILGCAVSLFVILQYGVLPRADGGPVSSTPVDVTEKRLRRLQQVALQKPHAAAETEAAVRALADAEKGLLKAATSALALAEMQQIMKELLRSEGISLASSEFGIVKAVSDDYAQVPLTVTFTCGIEHWINLMAALRNASQILSTLDLRMGQTDAKNKLIQVRLVVAGYIPASLVAASKGAAL